MREHSIALSRRTFIGGAVALGIAAAMTPSSAFAKTAAQAQADADSVRNQLVGLQSDLETASVNYGQALQEQEVAEAAMKAEQAKIDDANAKIATAQKQLGERARSMYRSGSSTFIDFILGATSFSEVTQNWDILNKMNENDNKLVDNTKSLRNELQVSKEEYAQQSQIAAQKASEAKQIHDDTQTKVDQASQLMQSLDNEAKQLLEQEQAAAAAAAAAKAAAAAAKAPTPSAAPAPQPRGGGGGPYSSVVGYARSCEGTPYDWGGATPGVGMDCSGLVSWCYAQIGISLGHQTETIYSQACNIVSVSQARPGDVLYRYGHVGIAAASGGYPYIHAPTFGAVVREGDPLSWAGFTHCLQF